MKNKERKKRIKAERKKLIITLTLLSTIKLLPSRTETHQLMKMIKVLMRVVLLVNMRSGLSLLASCSVSVAPILGGGGKPLILAAWGTKVTDTSLPVWYFFLSYGQMQSSRCL